MKNSTTKRLPNFVNVAIAILEAKVETVIGKEAVDEIKSPLLSKELENKLLEASRRAESRLTTQYPKSRIANTLAELPIADLPSMKVTVWRFYENPADPQVSEMIENQLRGVIPQQYLREELRAVKDYLQLLWEEMTAIPEIRERINAISALRTQHNTAEIVEILHSIDSRLANLNSVNGTNEKSGKKLTSLIPLKSYQILIGRSSELDKVLLALRDLRSKPAVAIIGMGGIGKTALAHKALDILVQDMFFEFFVWVSVKTEQFVGESIIKTNMPSYDFEQLLNDIGQQCGQDDIPRLPFEKKKSAIKHLLAEKYTLVVLDNLETIPENNRLVNEIIQMLGKSKILITSRHFIKHDQVFSIELHGLSDDEGIRFLREESNERGISIVANATDEDLIEINRVTGGAPLAMKLVIGQMSRQPMNMVLSELKEANILGQDYAFYEFIFKHSWDMLHLYAKKILIAMSAFPPGIGGKVGAVIDVCQIEEPEFRTGIDQLVIMSLVDSLGDLRLRRYAIHMLTYHFILSDIVHKWG